MAFVGTSVQGKFSGPDRVQRTLVPLAGVKVAPVILALEPSAATWPVSARLQGTGVNTNNLTAVAIEPVAVNDAPAGAKVAALAMLDVHARPISNAVKETRVVKLCIV